jgi:NAD(P)-dependent dehydrogenase (short-subunit alcohol dehydrogenase family)
MSSWTIADIPSQSGKLALVTGGTRGLGFETARALARAGAEVVLTGRNDAKGNEAVVKIRQQSASAKVEYQRCDLANSASVRDFARRFADTRAALHLLVNNAGVMAIPRRETTADGFEMQFGVNYLAHFALTAHLLPLLRMAAGARVVSLSSLAHRTGTIDFRDLQGERFYNPWKAYGQSKLAMLMFALELQRRSDSAQWNFMSIAAHPGWSRTDLFTSGPGGSSLFSIASQFAAPFLSQPAEAGALPILFAATDPKARGGGYYGPGGFSELTGPPSKASIMIQARDSATAKRLWDISETLTGVSFEGAH